MTILQLSTNKPIIPAVKINTSFLRLNAVRNAARIAPPTPKIPELKPERIQPMMAAGPEAGIVQLLFFNKNTT